MRKSRKFCQEGPALTMFKKTKECHHQPASVISQGSRPAFLKKSIALSFYRGWGGGEGSRGGGESEPAVPPPPPLDLHMLMVHYPDSWETSLTIY